jgi:chemotaxis signal transduction protein
VLVVVFQVVHERYALPARVVVEVLPRVLLSRVPHAVPWHAGLLAYRGTAVPVFDLNRRLLDAACPPRLGNRVLLVERERAATGQRERLGLLVEQVLEVRSLPANAQPSSTGTGRGLHVVSLAGGELLQMLDLDAVVGGDTSPAQLEGR